MASSPANSIRSRPKPPKPAKPVLPTPGASVLQCALCHTPYDGQDHEPKLLPCHHSFCLSCLQELAHDRPQIRCPDKECRRKFVTTNGGVEALKTNFYIAQMQSIVVTPSASVGATREKKENLCEKHLNQPLLFYCTTCMVPICMNCTVIDHDKNAGHQITDIASVVKSNQEIMKAKLDVVTTSIDEYQASLNILKTEISNLENAKIKTMHYLEETFNQLKTKLDQRKKELQNETEEIYNSRRQEVVTQAQSIKVKASSLNHLKQDMMEKFESNDIGNAVELANSLTSLNDMDKLCAQAREPLTCDNGYVRFHFEHGLQEYLLSIRSLGAVICDSGLPSDITIHSDGLIACVRSTIKVLVRDINGQPLSNYPVSAKIQHCDSKRFTQDHPLTPKLHEDGLYTFEYRPQAMGDYAISILFNGAPIWGATKTLTVQPNDPVLTFGSEGSAQGQLIHPTSAAVSVAGNIYVADMGNKRIQVFDANGRPLTSFSVGGSKSTTYDLTINHATEELLCSKVGPNDSGITVGNTIRIFGLRGEKLNNFSNMEMQRAMFIAVNSKGQILATDSLQHCIYIYSKEGVPIKKFGTLGQRHSQFNFPSAIAIGKDDSILVSDTKNNRVQIFNKMGKFMRQIGPEIEGLAEDISINAPRGIAADNVHILIADSLNRILVLKWDMQLAGVIGSENNAINEPYNLALSGDGHVIVADFQNNCIKKYRIK